jgi:antitoxin component of MazEF toxin-antitoxin module
MATISTKLIRDGNSMAIRLPKTVLALSGLRENVQMEVGQGQIVLRSARAPRSGWKEQIAKVMTANPAAARPDGELTAWDVTSADGLD